MSPTPTLPWTWARSAKPTSSQGGLTVGRVDTIAGADYLIVGTTTQNSQSVGSFTLLIYSLANPLSPQLVSDTSDFPDPLNGTDYLTGFLSDMVVEGNTVLVPTSAYYSSGSCLKPRWAMSWPST